MAESSVEVDLLNPGQVFACIGLAELTNALCGGVEGAFVWSADIARFFFRTPGDRDPLGAIYDFLQRASVTAIAPADWRIDAKEKWAVPTVRVAGDAFPIPSPSSAATLPAALEADGEQGKRCIVIYHWGDSDAGRDAVKFWGGSGGYPGSQRAADALDLVRDRIVAAGDRPFSVSAPQSSSFRLDWRRDYIPIDIGFSLNKHGRMTTLGYPVVEILAAIGLTHARPQRVDQLQYRYGVIGAAGDVRFDLRFLRAALGLAELPFVTRRFVMRLGWPGQEDKERSITTVTEENAT